jgi:hypothetical protein
MSIYSGFATRTLESTYNKTLCEMLNLLQSALIPYIRKGDSYLDSSEFSYFFHRFLNVFHKLRTFEQQKHLKPMFSSYCSELVDFAKGAVEDHHELPAFQDSFACGVNDAEDFQIINEGFGFDDSRMHNKFSPFMLETVFEKPKSRNLSRERAQNILYKRKKFPGLSTGRMNGIFKVKNSAALHYQSIALKEL